MSFGLGPLNSQSSYLPEQFELPEDSKLFQDFIAKRERLTSSILNIREIGTYEKGELLTAQQWFSLSNNPRKARYSVRKVFDLVDMNGGPIPAGPSSFPHGITGISVPTRIFGTATSTATPNYLPLPYVNVTTPGNDIEIYFDPTNVYINNAYGSNLDQCYVTFEYIKG
jgi:hypothetical protein